MRVLVACEFSGVVRDAFCERGIWASSCDLLPTERPHPERLHHRADVLDLFYGSVAHSMALEGQRVVWDLLIAFPPCKYLCNSGVRWLYRGGRLAGGKDPARWRAMRAAAEFVLKLWKLPVRRIAIENPIMHCYGQELTGWRQRRDDGETQIIQPWQFGHGETKATCLRLKNLPPLESTDVVSGRRPRVHHASPGPDRWRERSRTLPGIAAAMALQWGGLK